MSDLLQSFGDFYTAVRREEEEEEEEEEG